MEAHFRNMLKKALSFEESSGTFSVVAEGNDVVVSVDFVELAMDGAGELRTVSGPEEAEAIRGMVDEAALLRRGRIG